MTVTAWHFFWRTGYAIHLQFWEKYGKVDKPVFTGSQNFILVNSFWPCERYQRKIGVTGGVFHTADPDNVSSDMPYSLFLVFLQVGTQESMFLITSYFCSNFGICLGIPACPISRQSPFDWQFFLLLSGGTANARSKVFPLPFHHGCHGWHHRAAAGGTRWHPLLRRNLKHGALNAGGLVRCSKVHQSSSNFIKVHRDFRRVLRTESILLLDVPKPNQAVAGLIGM